MKRPTAAEWSAFFCGIQAGGLLAVFFSWLTGGQ